MKKLILLIAIQFFIAFYSYSQDLNYAKKLDSCFEPHEMELLNKACIAFEEQLKKQYSNFELDNAYLQYLKDLGEMKIHPSFFFSEKSKSVLQEIKSSTLFKKIWINLDSIETNNMFDEEDIVVIAIPSKNDKKEEIKNEKEIELFCVNPQAEYFKCVSSNMTNKELIAYYETLAQAPEISHILKSSALGYSLHKKDFKNDVLKLSIAIEFFIEMVLMFPDK